MNKDKIIDKIAKLMALGNSTNPNEAAIALARAQKLMQEYKISADDVSVEAVVEEEHAIPSIFRNRLLYTSLCQCICNAFGLRCIYLFNANNVMKAVTFIGPRERVAPASYAFTILVRQADFARKEFAKECRKELELKAFAEIMVNLVGHVMSFQPTLKYDEEFKNARNDLEEMRLQNRCTNEEIARIQNIVMHKLNYAADKYIRELIKDVIKVQLRKLSKMYLQGWLSSVCAKVVEFAVSDQENKLIDTYISRTYPELDRMKKTRQKRITAAELDAYYDGVRDGKEGVNLYHGVYGEAFAPSNLEYKKD